jgi:hypothetical protein
MPKNEIISIVLKGTEHDVKLDGVKAVDLETYNKIGIAGGFMDHSLDFNNHPAPFDISGLRFLRDDPKADAARRQNAGARMAEIESLLAETEPKKVEGK